MQAKINRDGPGGCWLWTGAINGSGYGSLAVGSRSRDAHRFAYEHFVDEIPEGLQLDHLCRVRHCVNPAHLEPVTPRENWLRGEAPSVANTLKTRCDHGHEFTPENTYIRPRGGRQCRACTNERQRRYQQRKKEVMSA